MDISWTLSENMLTHLLVQGLPVLGKATQFVLACI